MNGHLEAPELLLEAARSSRLLYYKHPEPVSRLECALPQFPATVHSNNLQDRLNPLECAVTRRPGGGVPSHFPLPAIRLLQRKQVAYILSGLLTASHPLSLSFLFNNLRTAQFVSLLF